MILAGGLVVVSVLISATIIYPVYRVGRNYERHFVWDPPVIEVGHGEEELPSRDLERLMNDPRQRAIIEGMKNMPREVPIRPIWIGPRTGPGRNWVGYFAMLATILYVGWLVQFVRR